MPQQVPASLDAEQALLGSMFLYPDTVDFAYEENLQPSDFFSDANKKIYAVIAALKNEGKPIDIASVITRLSDLQQLSTVGGADYIMSLTDLAVSSANSGYYIKNIMDKALLRKLIAVSEEIKMNCYEGQSDPYDVLNQAEKTILDVSRNRKTSEFVSSKTAFRDAIEMITQLSKKRGMTGVPSGYKYLDKITNGFQHSDLIILAARPSVGKTAFALNVAANAATKYGKKVALFSLEMPVIQLANRMLSAKSTVESNKIRTGQNLSNDDWAKLDQAKSDLENSDIYIDDSSSIKVNDIVAKCRKLQADEGLDMVIIDYLQLISGNSNSKDANRQQEVSDISRGLKGLARELDIPVIALSQLSRKVEDGNREPGLADLRESGAIEQDADIVMFLHREKKAKADGDEGQDATPDSTKLQDIKVIIGKHRNGSIGYVELAFDGKVNAFYTKEIIEDDYN